MHCVTLHNKSRSTLIGNRVQVADTSMSRLFGLLGRPPLTPGEGLWIKPSSGVHTFGMSFPIDVIGLDRTRTIVKLWPALVPWRITSISWNMQSVIELPSGQIEHTQCQLGDVVTVLKTTPEDAR